MGIPGSVPFSLLNVLFGDVTGYFLRPIYIYILLLFDPLTGHRGKKPSMFSLYSLQCKNMLLQTHKVTVRSHYCFTKTPVYSRAFCCKLRAMNGNVTSYNQPSKTNQFQVHSPTYRKMCKNCHINNK